MATICLAIGVAGCGDDAEKEAETVTKPATLAEIKQRGVLRMATRNGPTSYFLDRDRHAGFEYDLALRFAESLGVKLKVKVFSDFGHMLPAVRSGEADMAAANISVTPNRAELATFGPAYQHVRQQVIYRRGSKRPKKVEDLIGKQVRILAGTSYEQSLIELRQTHPQLAWQAVTGQSIEALFQALSDGDIDITVADSHILAIHRRLFPDISPAFALTEEQPLAWAFAPEVDPALISAAREFFARMEASGELQRLTRRYYRVHDEVFDYVGARTFLRHIEQRLPALQPMFEAAGKATGLDWLLLAAVGYQESHWNADARSMTGVEGIMMLTQATARQMGVEDRTDPQESIFGGARYLRRVMGKIPDRIEDPDALWLALAAYNVGFGHLEDARILTQRAGDNPDSWRDVRELLPKLSQEPYFSTTRYGYARGREPVHFVRNVRSYYDILVWVVGRDQTVANAAPVAMP